MKNFFTSMLGALVALLIFSVGACVMFFGFLGLIAALKNSEKAPAVESGAYVYLTEMVCDSGETFPLKGSFIVIR